jgi:GH35 family endo-1,4-beta-xylanase
MKGYFTVVFALLGFLFLGGSFSHASASTPPSCVITYPHSNAYYQAGSDMMIRVYSTGKGGSDSVERGISKVEFFVDEVLIGETTEGPANTYSFLWENVEAGTYRITSSATNDQGVSFTSAGVLVTVGTDAMVSRGLSAGKGKYLGNIISYRGPRNDYLQLWNGVTAENSSKWGSIEGTRDNMNWSGSDEIYNFAENNHLMYRYHAIAWGSQYPTWIESLSPNIDVTEFRGEVEEYMAGMAARYTYIDQIDVLNENLYLNTWNGDEHASGTPYFREGLGGPGETGYDWAIWLFEKAREYFPNSKLVLNDFELENNPDGIREMLGLVEVLRDRGLIDGFGTQAHTFNVDPMADNPGVLEDRISLMASGGVPVYVTELDLAGQNSTEASQLHSYKQLFPVYWEHPDVAGITLWGYVEGSTWKNGTGLLNADGTKKDAMLWLEEYMAAQPNVGYPHVGEEVESDGNLVSNGEFDMGTAGWSIQNNNDANGTMEVVSTSGLSGDNALKICPETPGTENWHVQVRHETPIVAGKEYDITFSAKAEAARPLDVAVQMDGGAFTNYFEASAELTTNAAEYNYSFTADDTDNIAKLKFYVGNDATCLFIDNVSFVEVDDSTPIFGPSVETTNFFKAWPNPVVNELLLEEIQEFGGSETFYTIYAMDGIMVEKGSFRDKTSLSLDGLQSGVYFLQLKNEGNIQNVKILKQ